jgi:hypothetical protein
VVGAAAAAVGAGIVGVGFEAAGVAVSVVEAGALLFFFRKSKTYYKI